MTNTTDSIINVKFHKSRQGRPINLQELKNNIIEFLEHYADYPLVDDSFTKVIKGPTGEIRYESLLKKAGFSHDSNGFLREVISSLETARHGSGFPLKIGSIELPYQLLLKILEVLVPGTGFRSIKSISQLEELTNIHVSALDRDKIDKILDLYPVRLSMHTIRQMRLSYGISRQYAPFPEELDDEGEMHTWVGQFHRGIVEQMYRNRVIFIMNMSCPVYCRFCFRKHKECRNQKTPTKPHVKLAIAYIKESPDIKEIVLTGGDPFMNKATLRFAIQELSKIQHIKTLRLASRAISYYPDLFLKDDENWLRYLIRTNLELMEKGKRIEIATHFVHPDEVSVESLDIITQLVQNGIQVYVQTPFINDCNDDWQKLYELFTLLRGAGAEMHYIFLPTSPIQGNKTYWAPMSKGLDTYRALRMHLSDRAMPHLTTATCIGKIDWNSSGWAVERHEDDPRYIWLRTPYDPDYFTPFAPILMVGQNTRINEEGTLDARFMSEIGDESLFVGQRTLYSSPEAHEHKLARTLETTTSWLNELKIRQINYQKRLCNLDKNTDPYLTRSHYSRVELDISAPEKNIISALNYIKERQEIKDIVIWQKDDITSNFSNTINIIDQLSKIKHLNCIRLRSLKLISEPHVFTKPIIKALGRRNQLKIVSPKRLEIETEILHSSQFRIEHSRLIRELRMKGITVYNNTPLLGYINDNENEILEISWACRILGIEFANVILAGTQLQNDWNDENPIALNVVIDIATNVRRNGSGREVPRYLVYTELGEVDFSISPRLFTLENDTLYATLRPHNINFYKSINKEYKYPESVQLTEEGHPIIPVKGLFLQPSGFLCDEAVDN